MDKLEVVYKNIADLIPYVNNARTHTDEQVAQVAASIREFGFTNAILIDEDGGVVAGHGRLLAARKLKMDVVPCVELKGLSKAQRKAYVLADNQLALNGGWNLDLLQVEIEGLKDLDFDVDLLGFDDDFLDEIFVDGSEGSKSGRGGHYNDIEVPDIDPRKLAYRIESLQKSGHKKSIELFAGRGVLSYWYGRSFDENITNDQQDFEDYKENKYNLKAIDFINNHLREHLDFDFIDFDDEGCPALEIQKFFNVINGKKETFVMAVTDGQGLNLKSCGKINFHKTYMQRENKTVQATVDDYYSFVDIFRTFIHNVSSANMFSCEELSLYTKDNGNVIYATYLVRKV